MLKHHRRPPWAFLWRTRTCRCRVSSRPEPHPARHHLWQHGKTTKRKQKMENKKLKTENQPGQNPRKKVNKKKNTEKIWKWKPTRGQSCLTSSHARKILGVCLQKNQLHFHDWGEYILCIFKVLNYLAHGLDYALFNINSHWSQTRWQSIWILLVFLFVAWRKRYSGVYCGFKVLHSRGRKQTFHLSPSKQRQTPNTTSEVELAISDKSTISHKVTFNNKNNAAMYQTLMKIIEEIELQKVLIYNAHIFEMWLFDLKCECLTKKWVIFVCLFVWLTSQLETGCWQAGSLQSGPTKSCQISGCRRNQQFYNELIFTGHDLWWEKWHQRCR